MLRGAAIATAVRGLPPEKAALVRTKLHKYGRFLVIGMPNYYRVFRERISGFITAVKRIKPSAYELIEVYGDRAKDEAVRRDIQARSQANIVGSMFWKCVANEIDTQQSRGSSNESGRRITDQSRIIQPQDRKLSADRKQKRKNSVSTRN